MNSSYHRAVATSFLALVVACAVGCQRRPTLVAEIAGIAPESPSSRVIVHPAERMGVEEIWAAPVDEGPFVVLRIKSSADLQALADTRKVSYVRYKTYACSKNPKWSREITSGPVFQVGGSNASPHDESSKGSHTYEVFLPVNLEAAVASSSRVGIDIASELQRAESFGLCIIIFGAKAFGHGFSSQLTRVPVSVSGGMIEKESEKEAAVDCRSLIESSPDEDRSAPTGAPGSSQSKSD